MFKVGDKVSIFDGKVKGTIVAVNVKEVPMRGKEDMFMYTFDDLRYAVLGEDGQVYYPKMQSNEVEAV